ncbi:MAG: TIGR03435 family protein [Acidobacteriota bacterium]
MNRVCIFLIYASLSFGQDPRIAVPPKFEVATIKPSPPNQTACGMNPAPGGERYVAACLPLRMVIWVAHWVKPTQVIGGPAWLDTDAYDIVGLASRPSNIDELHLMMQSLLTDRFGLRFHHETKEMPVYVLTLDRNGPKNLKQQEPANGSDLKIDYERDGLRRKWNAKFAPIAFFAWRLSQFMDRPIIDQTGLKGNYTFDLAFSDEPPLRALGNTDAPPSVEATGATIFEALRDQLGLKLERRTGPVDVIVIDQAQRPTEN